MVPGGFEEQPATKHDLAEVKEELSGDLNEVKGDLNEVKGDLVQLKEEVKDLRQTVESGFRGISELLQEGPPGLVKRVDRIEEHVGLQ